MTLPRVQAILDEQAQHRARLEGFCRSLTEQELAEQVPGTPWTVHGYVAHLATIDSLISFGGDLKVTDLPPPQVRLEALLWAIALHDPSHTQDILRAIPQREPDVRDWLASSDFARIPEEITARRA